MITKILIEILKELYKIRILLEYKYSTKINDANTNKHIKALVEKTVKKEFGYEYKD